MKRSIKTLLAAALCGLSLVSSGMAADKDNWAQWGGPNRDHKSPATGLKQSWPAGGPKVVWTFKEAGFGFSSPAVVDGKLYTLGMQDGKNYAIALDSKTGKELWRQVTGDEVKDDAYLHGWGGGPRSTPTVVGNRVIVLDDGGNLLSLAAATGKVEWKRNLLTDFGGTMPKWGYSESPLVDGDRVIVCPGGKEYLVGLNITSGEKIFGSTDYEEGAHYVSVIKHEVEGVPMYITANSKGVVAFSATDGKVLWKADGSGNNTATIPTPIVAGNLVYHTSNYNTGSILVKLSKEGSGIKAEKLYFSNDMQNHHGGVVLVDDHIFGVKKGAGFLCQNLKDGKMVWNHRLGDDGSASVAFADGRIYVYGDTTGKCFLVEPSTSAWKTVGELSLPEQTKLPRKQGKIWAHPVIAEGKLFLRDHDLLYAFDIAE